jgi:hypothetical protein
MRKMSTSQTSLTKKTGWNAKHAYRSLLQLLLQSLILTNQQIEVKQIIQTSGR